MTLEELQRQVMDNDSKLKALGDKAKDMSPIEIADYLGFTGKEREIFLLSTAAAQSAWKEVGEGFRCDCGRMAQFLGKKTTAVFLVDGNTEVTEGFDIFHFECGCGKKIDRRWRAPSLDGTEFTPYVTSYKFPDFPKKSLDKTGEDRTIPNRNSESPNRGELRKGELQWLKIRD